jgi:thiol-disulfide isomerase/thioredoxin
MAKGVMWFLSFVFLCFGGDLIFFYDEGCPYCKMEAQELVRNRDCVSRHRFYSVDINKDREYAMGWGVNFVPTLVFVENGRYRRVEGLILGEDLRRFLGCGY